MKVIRNDGAAATGFGDWLADSFVLVNLHTVAEFILNPPNDSAKTDSGLHICDISLLEWEKWPAERFLTHVGV